MATSVKETTIIQGEHAPGAVAVEELPFMRVRLPLLQPNQKDLIAVKRANDRTVALVRRYAILTENLPMVKSQTMSCFEAVEGKNGAVSLRICNRAKFDAIKQSVADMEEEQSRLEQAIRELDALRCGYLSEMQDARSSLAAIEGQQRQMLSGIAAGALQRGGNRRQDPEAVLQGDQLYQQRKTQAESQIATAKKALDVLIPKIEKIEAILSTCGC